MSASTSTPAAVGCTQPGCNGNFLDGYCDVCGYPEAAQPSQITGSSHALGKHPLGSARGVTASRRRTTGSGRSRAVGLGAGITSVPPLPVVDAATALMKLPEVPEGRRFCPEGHPVGRSRPGRPGRSDGFCINCGSAYSFSPKLLPGMVVAGQYEVAGCLAYGGLGWVYLARDRNVSDRWVVLKGLLNSGDPDAVAAAIAEREFLARVEHPLIVDIYNFVSHDGAGYIVMEYVGGASLKELLTSRARANGGSPDPLPADQAIAFILEVLPAFAYLHNMGLLYCDFKPDNIIQVGDSIKLIDLGGVLRVDDKDSAIYGTVGYQAPEVAVVGPSVASEIYTIGRTLLSLAIDFRGNTTTYKESLPAPDDAPLLLRHDSLSRWLSRACAADPADRFGSCDEMRVQLLGVLREVVATDRVGDRAADDSTASTLFRPPAAHDEMLTWQNLPPLLLEADDPQLTSVLGNLPPDADNETLITGLQKVVSPSIEVQLHLARTAIGAGRTDLVEAVCTEILAEDPWEWRAVWFTGLAALQRGDHEGAQHAFDTVYGEVPGELAPKLALALACEPTDRATAERFYFTCLRTDANYIAAAAFGLARVRAAAHQAGSGGLDAVIAAYDQVPAASRVFVLARQLRAEYLLEHGDDFAAYADALDGVRSVTLDPVLAARLRSEALAKALAKVQHDPVDPAAGAAPQVAGVPVEESLLRSALEAAYRSRVPLTDDPAERVRLVDAARAVRAWSWT